MLRWRKPKNQKRGRERVRGDQRGRDKREVENRERKREKR